MQIAYVQVAVLVGVFVSGAFGDLVKGGVSSDGLCTYTFRDVCVSQRMSDVKKLRATVDSQQAQITLLNNVVAAIPHMRTVMHQQQRTIDELKGKIGSYLYGAEYQVYSTNYFSTENAQSLHDNNVPCAVCLLTSRKTKLMIPAKLTCPNGWTKEYSGYLMSERVVHASSKTYVCVDNAPEIREGGRANEHAALFYNVEAKCGSLPCPKYKAGWDITCVVCSK
ncbi:hypothetical protein NP493_540g02021 [Ridgeia piscesae]|uniref:Uncharacterized protein n=1 Tax=Ridgeia piscesae TaxID=27915 RepID=A0AAD9KXE0_RIDPI|nr:hypothetical protein NP493_540g02021 [Ridgeia piscesae]